MVQVLAWWISLQIVGWLAWPLARRLFRSLPDRGLFFTIPLGLLVSGYAFWLGGILHMWRADGGGVLAALIILAAISALYSIRSPDDDPLGLRWLRKNRNLVLVFEALFTLAFLAWAFFRAYNPEIMGTEKPMEFAFLNGIFRSDFFPPIDPWLSGYAISYYYFGYVMLAFLTRMSSVAPAFAFNLGVAGWFALAATAAFGLGYDLVALLSDEEPVGRAWRWIGGALASTFLVLMGNLEGFLESLHTAGVGGQGFYRWLDIKGLASAPVTGSWFPTAHWWWWKASRVIHDRDLLGNSVEVIDEFPQFSFVLGDMHPHVLALPFGLLAAALALQVFLSVERGRQKADGWTISLREDAPMLFFVSLALGGLAFLNTWDFPFYWLLFVGAYALALVRRRSDGWLKETAIVGVAVGVAGVLLYLPFYVGFSSQAGGVLPNLLFPTRWQQYAVMWLPLVWPAVLLMAALSAGRWRSLATRWGSFFLYAVVLPIAFWILMLVLAFGTPMGRKAMATLLNSPAVQKQAGHLTFGSAMGLLARVRLAHPVTFLLLALLLAWGVALIFVAGKRREDGGLGDADSFVLLMISLAFLLQFLPEFVYLRDSFGTRMNTVFKFYFLAWALLSVAGAYGVARFWHGARPSVRQAGVGFAALLLLLGLVYPLAAIPSKAGGFRGRPTLDGIAFFRKAYPDDAAAIAWLRANVQDAPVVLEATGGSYTDAARVSEITGFPTLLGWGGHELQWRGSYRIPGEREKAIQQIYQSAGPKELPGLLARYGVKYVYVGRVEREKYHISPNRLRLFDRLMDRVYDRGSVRIYAVRPVQ